MLQLDPTTTVAELDRTIATLPTYGPPTTGEVTDNPAIVTAPVTDSDPLVEPREPVIEAPAPVEEPEPATGAPPYQEPRLDPPLAPPSEPRLRLPDYELAADEKRRSLSTQPAWSDDLPAAKPETSRLSPRARVLFVAILLGGLAVFLIIDLLIFREDSSSQPAAESPQAIETAGTANAASPTDGAASGADSGEAQAGQPEATEGAGGQGSGAGNADTSRTGEQNGAGTSPDTGAAAVIAGANGGQGGNGGGPAPLSKTQQVEISTPRGESWLLVRRGSSSGRILYEGLLAPDGSLSFEAKTLFMRVGAASAIDISQDGTVVSEGLEGTLDFELSRARGLRVVS